MKTLVKITGVAALLAMLTFGSSTVDAQRRYRRSFRSYYPPPAVRSYYGWYGPYYRGYYNYYPNRYRYYYYGYPRAVPYYYGYWGRGIPNTYPYYYYNGIDDRLYEYLVLRGLLRDIL